MDTEIHQYVYNTLLKWKIDGSQCYVPFIAYKETPEASVELLYCTEELLYVYRDPSMHC